MNAHRLSICFLLALCAGAQAESVLQDAGNPPLRLAGSEDPEQIMADIAGGCSGAFQLVTDRAEAIALAIATARAGDCVVIAGKGHEDYQVINGERRYFSDAEQAQAALASRLQA